MVDGLAFGLLQDIKPLYCMGFIGMDNVIFEYGYGWR